MRPVCHPPAEGGGPAAHTRRLGDETVGVRGGGCYGQRELGLDDGRGQLLYPAFPLGQLPATPRRWITDPAEVTGEFGRPTLRDGSARGRRARPIEISVRRLVQPLAKLACCQAPQPKLFIGLDLLKGLAESYPLSMSL